MSPHFLLHRLTHHKKVVETVVIIIRFRRETAFINNSSVTIMKSFVPILYFSSSRAGSCDMNEPKRKRVGLEEK